MANQRVAPMRHPLRHCEPTGRANARPMTGSAKQSISPRKGRMDCFVASLLAMTIWLFENVDSSCPDLIRASINLRNKLFQSRWITASSSPVMTVPRLRGELLQQVANEAIKQVELVSRHRQRFCSGDG